MIPNDNSYEKIKSLIIPQENVRKHEFFLIICLIGSPQKELLLWATLNVVIVLGQSWLKIQRPAAPAPVMKKIINKEMKR